MSKKTTIEPGATYCIGVFTPAYQKTNEKDNPVFRKGMQYSYQGSILNKNGINSVPDFWVKNPFNLSTTSIWNIYKIDDETGAKQWIAEGQFVTTNESLSDDNDNIPDAIRSQSKSALADNEQEQQYKNEIIRERDYLRNRVAELEKLNTTLTQQITNTNNSLSDEAQKRMNAEMELRQAVYEATQEKDAEIMELKYQLKAMKEQHESEIELKQKAIEETLRDEMKFGELEIQKQQQETLTGLLSMGKPVAELAIQAAVIKLTEFLSKRSNNNQQEINPAGGMQQVQQQEQMAQYDPNAEPNMYVPEVLT